MLAFAVGKPHALAELDDPGETVLARSSIERERGLHFHFVVEPEEALIEGLHDLTRKLVRRVVGVKRRKARADRCRDDFCGDAGRKRGSVLLLKVEELQRVSGKGRQKKRIQKKRFREERLPSWGREKHGAVSGREWSPGICGHSSDCAQGGSPTLHK